MPGPGNHSPDYKIMKSAAPSYGFPKENRKNSHSPTIKLPGPGSYSIPGIMGKDGPSKSMAGLPNYSPELRE